MLLFLLLLRPCGKIVSWKHLLDSGATDRPAASMIQPKLVPRDSPACPICASKPSNLLSQSVHSILFPERTRVCIHTHTHTECSFAYDIMECSQRRWHRSQSSRKEQLASCQRRGRVLKAEKSTCQDNGEGKRAWFIQETTRISKMSM